MELSVIVPTYNEAPNVAELVRRAGAACAGMDAEIVFVDDSRDDTPDVIRGTAARSAVPVRLIHRDVPAGGLGGAVIDGIRSSAAVHCVVMDGDLQHPPELIPVILASLRDCGADVVVASRYCGSGGSAGGPANGARRIASSGSTVLAKGLFPTRLKDCSDPMTGFFGFRRCAVDVEKLRPAGFTILLELLARHRLEVTEVPLVFGERHAGESKASFTEGVRYLRQLTVLRFGRLAGYGLVGGIGAVLNLLIMAALIALGSHYVAAAVVAAEVTILTNFLMQEHLVFHADRRAAPPVRRRFLQSFAYNNIDAAARLPVLWWLVEHAGSTSLAAQAGTLAGAFVLRYLYHVHVVYRPAPAAALPAATSPAATGPRHADPLRAARPAAVRPHPRGAVRALRAPAGTTTYRRGSG